MDCVVCIQTGADQGFHWLPGKINTEIKTTRWEEDILQADIFVLDWINDGITDTLRAKAARDLAVLFLKGSHLNKYKECVDDLVIVGNTFEKDVLPKMLIKYKN